MSPAMPATLPAATPATAVEVVTSLGGSIVSVDTLTASTASRRRGWGVLGAGAVLVTLALGTFFYGVAGASHDAAARERWIAEKRPSWAFRPTRHSPAADVAALVGAIAGLGLIATGLLRRRGVERSRLRVGQNDGVDIPLADAPPERTLVDRDPSGAFFAPLDGLEGDVAFAGTATTLASMRAAGHVALPLYVGTQVRTKIGSASFFVRGITAPTRSAPAAMGWDQRTLAFVAASAVVHLGLWAMIRTVPPDLMGVTVETDALEETSSRATHTSVEELPPPPPDDGEEDDGSAGANTPPNAIALEDGTLGTDRPNATPALLRVQDRNLAPTLSREQAKAVAAESGILGSTVFTGPIAVVGGGDLASGFDDLDITGGFYDGGGEGGPAGSFGWGLKGTGAGCGTLAGVPCGGVEAGGFLIGQNGGDRYRGPLGDGGPGTRRHVNAVPRVVISKPTTCHDGADDCLDPAIIRRYIKRNIEKIAYCYEKELLARPDLEGTVTALFTLTANGQVVSSKASGVDSAVSSCIAGVITNISFPKVAETGVYPIKYPFQLHRR